MAGMGGGAGGMPGMGGMGDGDSDDEEGEESTIAPHTTDDKAAAGDAKANGDLGDLDGEEVSNLKPATEAAKTMD